MPFHGEQHRLFLQRHLTAFPDAHIEVTLLIAQGNYVFVHWTGNGTQTGPLHTPTGGSIPATGKPVVLKVSETHELKGGKIAHIWGFFDRVSLLGELGVMPPMEPSRAPHQDALVGEPAARSTGGRSSERLVDQAVKSHRRTE